jgi:hypothetical protein
VTTALRDRSPQRPYEEAVDDVGAIVDGESSAAEDLVQSAIFAASVRRANAWDPDGEIPFDHHSRATCRVTSTIHAMSPNG